jgi:hypothetical protein
MFEFQLVDEKVRIGVFKKIVINTSRKGGHFDSQTKVILSRLCNFLSLPASSICFWTFGLWPNSLIYFPRKGLKTPSLGNKQRQEQISRGLQAQKVAKSR